LTRQDPSESLLMNGLIELASPSVPMTMLPPGLPRPLAAGLAAVVPDAVLDEETATLGDEATAGALAAVVPVVAGRVATAALLAVGVEAPPAALVGAVVGAVVEAAG
jgi:hypothetical protein